MGLTKAEREAREAREAELEAVQEAAAGDSLPEGVSLTDAKPAELDPEAYPERPYTEALTEEHRQTLADAHQLPEE